jgi:hypothetical protein
MRRGNIPPKAQLKLTAQAKTDAEGLRNTAERMA